MKNQNLNKVYKIFMTILITALITFLITSMYFYKKIKTVYSLKLKNNSTASKVDTSNTSIGSILSEFRTILDQKYIGEINDKKMTDAAIKGYISGLGDEYTEYLTKEEMKALVEETSSEYVGIGVYVSSVTSNNSIIVVGVLKDSPAEEAGIKPGDYIIKLDDKTYLGNDLTEAVTVMKGKENTSVKVTVKRDEQELDINVTRRKIEVQHVASKVVSDDIGYIQIDAFDEGVAEDFEKMATEFKDKNINKLIIDLRSNGGGVVSESTKIADLFSDKDQTLLITKSKNSEEKPTKATREKVFSDFKVVVLINQYTASASEILAGALRDNYGAKIVGMTSFGKGVIQTVYQLTDGSGIKITTDEYYTPNHNEIHKKGIKPDVEVELTRDENGKYNTSEGKDAQINKAIEELNK